MKTRIVWIGGLIGLWILAVSVIDSPYPVVQALGVLVTVGLGLGLLVWAVWRFFRWFLWRVGRRLAFTYFLIGLVPIPLVLLLLAVALYILAGFFLAHLYRDTVDAVHRELATAADVRLESFRRTGSTSIAGFDELAFGYYREGVRVGGDPSLPAAWPAWLEQLGLEAAGPPQPTFVALEGERPGLAVARGNERLGVLGVFTGDLSARLREASGVWVELHHTEDPHEQVWVSLAFGARTVTLQPIRFPFGRTPDPGFGGFFDARSEGHPHWDRPSIAWVELADALRDMADGTAVAPQVAATLVTTPRITARHLLSPSPEIDTAAWIVLIVLAILLLDIYAVAVLVAFFMIFGLTRAVNRLSRATRAIRSGDFSVRIPVRRKDQLGDLQRSFNDMAADLEQLVVAEAHKEALEAEIELARRVQRSLIPEQIPRRERLELATLFEPSAAIGGDYFDVMEMPDGRVAVVIADVSGHGLSSGLRMAMLKAALQILVEQAEEPREIFRRLDGLVRGSGEKRLFVTASLALFDPGSGMVELTNAGHPPTYLVRADGRVEEIALPSSPLGGLGAQYVSETLQLAPGDSTVFLSDGFIEAADPRGRPFGYEAVPRALAGPVATAEQLRDRLVETVLAHVGTGPVGDDRSLVVVRYREAESGSPTTSR